jgi:hypothetical protein
MPFGWPHLTEAVLASQQTAGVVYTDGKMLPPRRFWATLASLGFGRADMRPPADTILDGCPNFPLSIDDFEPTAPRSTGGAAFRVIA